MKSKYYVYSRTSGALLGTTFAYSEAQAINNVRYRLGNYRNNYQLYAKKENSYGITLN